MKITSPIIGGASEKIIIQIASFLKLNLKNFIFWLFRGRLSSFAQTLSQLVGRSNRLRSHHQQPPEANRRGWCRAGRARGCRRKSVRTSHSYCVHALRPGVVPLFLREQRRGKI